MKEPRDDDDLDEYDWVKRHSWHSWRERYVRNQAVLDPIIDEFVAVYPPEDRVVDHRDRRFRRPALRQKRLRESNDESEDDSEDGSDIDPEEVSDEPVQSRHPKRLRHIENSGRRTTSHGQRDRNTELKQNKLSQDKGKGRATEITPPLEEDLISFHEE